MGGELGQVTPGYLADLLLVDGDPLADVSILQDQRRLLAIMKDGVFHKGGRSMDGASVRWMPGRRPGSPLCEALGHADARSSAARC